MSTFCLAHGVRLLAYGTLAGGLLSERWLLSLVAGGVGYALLALPVAGSVPARRWLRRHTLTIR